MESWNFERKKKQENIAKNVLTQHSDIEQKACLKVNHKTNANSQNEEYKMRMWEALLAF